MLTVAHSFWDDLVDPLKVNFDGENRLIILKKEFTEFNVKIDLYSAAKRWLQRRQNLSYLTPLRAIGGDALAGGLFAGDIYFLINNWRIVVESQITLSGIIYNENVEVSPFIIRSGGGVVATVSNLAYSYNTVGTVVPTAQDISNSVWSRPITTLTDSTTIGGKVIDTTQTVEKIKTLSDNILATNL